MKKIIWLLVQFTYPKSSNRHIVSNKFQKEIVKIGFGKSIKDSYAKPIIDSMFENAVEQVKSIVPLHGNVSILRFTDEQFSNIINYVNIKAGTE